MVSHDQVQRDDVVARYVRNELGSDERLTFEEHFFECEECFGELLPEWRRSLPACGWPTTRSISTDSVVLLAVFT
jgi:hypothetical protein